MFELILQRHRRRKVSIKGANLFESKNMGPSVKARDKKFRDSLSLGLALSPFIMYASSCRRSGKVTQLLNMAGIDV